jgi:uncharacterized protein (DUF1697 family)
VTTFIAFFRGNNVGGRSTLPMKELVTIFESLGARDVRTYINSGNVVFRLDNPDLSEFSRRFAAAIRERYGFEPGILVLSPGDLEEAVRENPFPGAVREPAALHLGFLARVPERPDLEKLTALRKETEQFSLRGRVFYLYAPEGVGRSRLAAGAEKALGVPMTDRNWGTVMKIREMVRETGK